MNIHFLFILPLATAAFSTRPLSRVFRTTSLTNNPAASSLKHQYQRYHHHQPYYNSCNNRRNVHVAKSQSGSGEKGADSKMKILGVCGGIGSGKSTACKLMVDSLGCVARIDADLLAHEVYEPGSKALEEIAMEFGKDILEDDSIANAQIDRKKLGAIVFSDAESMSKLEQIVWPHVRDKIEKRIDEIALKHKGGATSNDIIIVEAALLLETNWHDLLDGLWVIQSSQSVATQRLKESRGLTEEDALVRIRAQDKRRGIGSGNGEISDKLCEEMKHGVVTAVITNNGTLENLEGTLENAMCDTKSFKW